jgi:hypothetical protein
MKWKRYMVQVQRLCALGVLAMAVVSTTEMKAQAGDPATLIQEKLVSQIKITKSTADRSDIVTAGDVVVLHKDGLMMCSSSSSYAFSNSYSNGVLAANYKNRAKDAIKSFGFGHVPVFGGGTSAGDAANNGCPSRKFVAGEKFWITGIVAQKDGILVSTFSDPYPDPSGNQVRYYGDLKFPFAKGSVPSPEDFVKTFSEVIAVDSVNAESGQGGQNAQAAQAPEPAQAAPAQAPMPDVAPPPPPTDAAPPTISLGQTEDQVTAAFGQPVKTAKVGVKDIFYYKDMKVTFTKGKVTDVE